MLLGTHEGGCTLILGAADTYEELKAFRAMAVAASPPLYRSEGQPSPADMMLDARFHNFTETPFLFEFDTNEALLRFAETYGVSLVPHRRMVDQHLAMVLGSSVDPYMSPDADKRPLAEILGLDKEDPWDQRTDEQKVKDAEYQKKAAEAKKAGNLSGDSFGAGKKAGGAAVDASKAVVTDIRLARQADGSISIDNVLVAKGVYDDNGKGLWKPTDVQAAAADPTRPANYVYSARTGENGQVHLAITHLAHWREHNTASGERMNLPDDMRPTSSDGMPATETQAAGFVVTGKTVEVVDAEMVALGYVDCPEFKLLMGGIVRQPVITQAKPGEHFIRFAMPETNGLSMGAALDTLGALPESLSTDGVVLEFGRSPTETWFVIRDERLGHRLAGLFEARKLAYRVDVVDQALSVIRPFAYDAEVAQEIDPEGMIAIYHRLDVWGIDLAVVLQDIRAASEVQEKDLLASIVSARGQMPDHCWLACATKRGAETLEAILRASSRYTSTEIEVYGVNDRGERLMPKGIQIVEAVVEAEPPRPWNSLAAEWDAMDAETRKKDGIRITGKEFIYCGDYKGPANGCIVYIVPARYFKEHGELWEGPIDFTLPSDLKQVRPGIYQTKSRGDWLNLQTTLSGAGMGESMMLQMHVNLLD